VVAILLNKMTVLPMGHRAADREPAYIRESSEVLIGDANIDTFFVGLTNSDAIRKIDQHARKT
jgi:hypothetical protein